MEILEGKYPEGIKPTTTVSGMSGSIHSKEENNFESADIFVGENKYILHKETHKNGTPYLRFEEVPPEKPKIEQRLYEK